MKRPAVFLDRDGTINYDPGYINDPKQVILYPGVKEGIAELKNKYGFLMIVVSNQSGISRGLMTHDNVCSINKRINELLSSEFTAIDYFYYCPHHPDESCSCRKPSPEMVLRAASEHEILLERSYFIGDKASDVECGIEAGVKSILLRSDIFADEINTLKKGRKTPNFVAGNFLEACEFIIKDFMEATV